MTKIKRFIDCYIPTETCNLQCHYCYIAQNNRFSSKLAHFTHSKEEIREAFSQKRLGGPCLINLCAGGETLLSNEVLPIVKELILEGHYVMIVTNGTLTKRFEEVATWSEDILSHLFFKFSFHYLELVRLNIMDKYFNNVQLMKKIGASFTVEITPSDELVPYIDKVKQVCIDKLGALCHVTIARDDRTQGIDVLSKYDFETYKKIWGTFDSGLFEFKTSIFYKKRKEFCYAGDWSVYVNLETGQLTQCYCGEKLGNIYDLSTPIKFKAIGCNCLISHCYNGHAFLTLGDIPSLKTPTYAYTRNRVCSDGTEWLQHEMKEVMECKLSETNSEYSKIKKYFINNPNVIKKKIKRIKKRLSR